MPPPPIGGGRGGLPWTRGLQHGRSAAGAPRRGRAATDDLGAALAALGEAYEQLDEASGDRLEEALFRPVQVAYGRAKRTHAEFAARVGSPGGPSCSPSPDTRRRASGFIDGAVSAMTRADDRLGELQDSMRPVDVGDAELRAGLSEVRRLIDGVPARARDAHARSLAAAPGPPGEGPGAGRGAAARRDGPDERAAPAASRGRGSGNGDGGAQDAPFGGFGGAVRSARAGARRRRRDDEVRARTAGAARGPVRGAAGAGRADGRVSDRS